MIIIICFSPLLVVRKNILTKHTAIYNNDRRLGLTAVADQPDYNTKKNKSSIGN